MLILNFFLANFGFIFLYFIQKNITMLKIKLPVCLCLEDTEYFVWQFERVLSEGW